MASRVTRCRARQAENLGRFYFTQDQVRLADVLAAGGWLAPHVASDYREIQRALDRADAAGALHFAVQIDPATRFTAPPSFPAGSSSTMKLEGRKK